MIFALKRTVNRTLMSVLRLLAKLLHVQRPILFTGVGASRRLCGAVAQMGARRVLLVTDRGLVGLGMHEAIVEELERLGVATAVYDGVEPDPSYRQVEDGLALLREHEADAVVALGGGSPIDAAKVISVMATNRTTVRKLVGFLKVRKPGLPFFAIPTTAGTGSEVTVAAVVSDPETHLKTPIIDTKLVPQMAALDPELMAGMPPGVTADTGLDALTHAVEAYLSRNATVETDRFALAAIRLVFDQLPKAYADGRDLEAREAMAMASFYAGLAFTKTSVGYVHAVAHSFGAHYQVPHGRANAIVMPHVLEFSKSAATPRMAAMARALGLDDAEHGGSENDSELAERFIAAIRELITGLGIPERLESLKREDIPMIAGEALKEAHYNYPVPRYMNRVQCEAMLAAMLA
ncbi:MAG: iron-containing alcohol dehydrogenase [Acidobacteriota bacterium]